MTKNGKKLKTGLYGIPIFMVPVMAVIIYIAFHLTVNAYVAHLAEQNIEARFERLDAYYNDTTYEGYYDLSSDFIITVHHMILDDAGRLLSPDATWGFLEELKLAKELSARVADGSLVLKDGQGRTLKLDKNTYYLIQRTYFGEYDGSFVVKGGSGREYSALAYIDITPIAAFLRVLDRVFFLLVMGLSLAAALILLWTGKGLNHSFQSLKEYIMKSGERHTLTRMAALPYMEFNEIADTVFQMSRQLEEAEAAQVKFFQNASHELRTPLTAIRGYAEGIASGVMQDVVLSANIIVDHSDKMSALVDELLYSSKLDSYMEASGDEVFDLPEILRRSLWSVAGSAEERNLRLDLHIQAEDVSLRGSEEIIVRALTNILSNAVRYAQAEIDVSLVTEEELAIITIADDGTGIAEEDLPHIFERFYKGRGGVTGLGLSITQEAVRRHRGSIAVSSKYGNTVFTVTLPIHSTQKSEQRDMK